MQMEAEATSAGLILRILETRIDAAGAIDFKETVRDATEQPGTPVIMDLSRVTFLDSSGLGAIVAVMKLLGSERPLQLAAVHPNVAKVFRLTQMNRIFTILPELPAPQRAAG